MNKLGRITSVFVDPDSRDIFVNVSISGRTESRQMPFMSLASGMWIVPREGDIVEVSHTEREFVARFPQSPPEFEMPEALSEGDFCFKFDDDTELKFQKNGDGDIDVTVKASGELRLLDSDGYGIVGEGEGSFTWYHNEIEFDPDGTFEE